MHVGVFLCPSVLGWYSKKSSNLSVTVICKNYSWLIRFKPSTSSSACWQPLLPGALPGISLALILLHTLLHWVLEIRDTQYDSQRMPSWAKAFKLPAHFQAMSSTCPSLSQIPLYWVERRKEPHELSEAQEMLTPKPLRKRGNWEVAGSLGIWSLGLYSLVFCIISNREFCSSPRWVLPS